MLLHCQTKAVQVRKSHVISHCCRGEYEGIVKTSLKYVVLYEGKYYSMADEQERDLFMR